MDALKIFNEGSELWSVPRKDTKIMRSLKRIMTAKPSTVDMLILRAEARGKKK